METLSIANIETKSMYLGDIPLIFGLVNQLGVVSCVDSHIKEHGNHEGLSSGWLVAIWLVHLLHTGEHTKSPVESWAKTHKKLLERLSGQTIGDKDFEDNRLGRLLSRLSQEASWLKIESALWSEVVDIYELPSIPDLFKKSMAVMAAKIPPLPIKVNAGGFPITALERDLESSKAVGCIHIDFSGSCGYHEDREGLMKYGKSKDHRADLRQFKLLGASVGAYLLSAQAIGGNEADDPYYLPMASRSQKIVKKKGILYAGDSKMSALHTRATLQEQENYYLTRLPETKGNAALIKEWIDQGLKRPLSLIYKEAKVIGGGYELSREQSAKIKEDSGKEVKWTERVLVVRSSNYAEGQEKQLLRRIVKAEDALSKLTPIPGRGKRQIRTEQALKNRITAIYERYELPDNLFAIQYKPEIKVSYKFIGRGRSKKEEDRPKKKIETVRFQIQGFHLNKDILQQATNRLGWIVYVTQVPSIVMNLTQAVLTYRNNNQLENQFRQLKNAPLNIRPLWVWKDDQIKGLTYLLTIATRLIIYTQTILAKNLEEQENSEDQQIIGLYPESPNKSTISPTFNRCCKAFSNAKITSINIYLEDKLVKNELHRFNHIHYKILTLLNIPITIYTELRI